MYALVLDGDWNGQDQVRAVLLGTKAYLESATCFDPYNQYWLASASLTQAGARRIDDCQFGNSYAAGIYKVNQ